MKTHEFRFWKPLLAVFALLLAGLPLAPSATAQTNGASVSDEDKAIHYSLYYENFKNQNYADALPDLLWIVEHAPFYPRNNDTNYERLVIVYDSLAARNPAEQMDYLNKALELYETAPGLMDAAGAEYDVYIWTRNKGRFIQSNLSAMTEHEQKAIDAYRKLLDLDFARTDPYYIDVVLSDYYKKQDIAAMQELLGRLREERGDDEKVQAISAKYAEAFDPEDQLPFYEEQLAADPQNIEVMAKLLELYNELEMPEEALDMSRQLLDLAEGAKAAEFTNEQKIALYRSIVSAEVNAGNISQAKAIFDKMQAMGAELKPQDYYNLGTMDQNASRFGSALANYRKALEIDPNFAPAQRAIPSLYATAVSTCPVSDREAKAVYWYLADLLRNAGMGGQAATYERYGPSAEDIFFLKWQKGSSVPVNFSCNGVTLSGTTRVR